MTVDTDSHVTNIISNMRLHTQFSIFLLLTGQQLTFGNKLTTNEVENELINQFYALKGTALKYHNLKEDDAFWKRELKGSITGEEISEPETDPETEPETDPGTDPADSDGPRA